MPDPEASPIGSVDLPSTEGQDSLVTSPPELATDNGDMGKTTQNIVEDVEPTHLDNETDASNVVEVEKSTKSYEALTPRDKMRGSLDQARKLIETKLAESSLPEVLQESAKVALTYNGNIDTENTRALQALGEVLGALEGTPGIDLLLKNISAHQRFATKPEWDAGISFTSEEWERKREGLEGDDLKGFDDRAIIGYEFPPEGEAVPVNPEDLLIQEGIAALSARRDAGEALTPDQEGQLKLLELAASAKGEGGLLLKIQLLKKIGLETDGDTELAGRLEAAQGRLDSILLSAGVKDEDLELLSELSSTDVSAFMARALTLSVGGLDTFIFGEKMSIEDMQKMLQKLPLSQEKKDALDKMPLGLPIGLGILFALLSAGLVVGKASMKEMRK